MAYSVPERGQVRSRRLRNIAISAVFGVGPTAADEARRSADEAVAEAPSTEPLDDDEIILYLHPDVPEASLVLVRRRRAGPPAARETE